MNEPLVSILIPMFNAERTIAEALKSCLTQTYKNIEIIVVDDGSTDNSLAIARKYEKDNQNMRVLSQQNRGACAARNIAFNNSVGSYIQYLDSDDLIPPRKIELQMDRLRQFQFAEGVVAFSSFQHLRNEKLEHISRRLIDKDYDNPKELLIDLISTTINLLHCYLIPRQLVEISGGWDESVLKNQDGEFFSRILFLANKAVFVPDIEVTWRHTGSGISITHSIETMRSQLYVANKISDLILGYTNTNRAISACAAQYGWIAYLGYPENRQLLPEIEQSLKKRNLPFVIPYKGRLFRLISVFFGWRIASRIVNNKLTIQVCNWISGKSKN
ncbi:MAG: glycosyltransferase family 2 protein [Nitrospira sp.]|nr:glycosyltransferase family 2 protein [Nitrospira sp.]